MKIGENTAKTSQIAKKMSVAYVLEKGVTIFRWEYNIPKTIGYSAD